MPVAGHSTAIAAAVAVGIDLALAGASETSRKLRGAQAAPPADVGPANESHLLAGSEDTDYDHYFDKNAFAPHGATDIDTDETAPSGLTPQQCEERCSADASCACVTQERATGKCWKHGNCDPSKWVSDYTAGYNVYMKHRSVPPSPGPEPPSTSWFSLRLYIDQSMCMKAYQTWYDGTEVQIYECSDGDVDQYWTAGSTEADINGQVRWAAHQDQCLDVKDHHTCDGTLLQLSECSSNSLDQSFYFDTSSRPASADSQFIPRPIGRLRWKSQPSKCAVAQYGSASVGNSIVLADCVDGQDAQYWVNDYIER
eukprot:TRINITY_DN519_c0_g1_i3.p1 TRINITY_DN519_c0_g1~~TRINITY_DN519_c0_g1_i3.p1  ORF type:complete len:348 (-),score=39.55 TRINITY_DN519_c0_g1_i3:251-1186(-)